MLALLSSTEPFVCVYVCVCVCVYVCEISERHSCLTKWIRAKPSAALAPLAATHACWVWKWELVTLVGAGSLFSPHVCLCVCVSVHVSLWIRLLPCRCTTEPQTSRQNTIEGSSAGSWITESTGGSFLTFTLFFLSGFSTSVCLLHLLSLHTSHSASEINHWPLLLQWPVL